MKDLRRLVKQLLVFAMDFFIIREALPEFLIIYGFSRLPVGIRLFYAVLQLLPGGDNSF